MAYCFMCSEPDGNPEDGLLVFKERLYSKYCHSKNKYFKLLICN